MRVLECHRCALTAGSLDESGQGLPEHLVSEDLELICENRKQKIYPKRVRIR